MSRGDGALSGCLPRRLHPCLTRRSASSDNTLIVWDVQRGSSLRTLRGHEAAVSCLTVVGRRVLSGSHDGTVREWDWRDGSCVRAVLLEPRLARLFGEPSPPRTPTRVSALSYHAPSATVAIGDCAGGLRLLEWSVDADQWTPAPAQRETLAQTMTRQGRAGLGGVAPCDEDMAPLETPPSAERGGLGALGFAPAAAPVGGPVTPPPQLERIEC